MASRFHQKESKNALFSSYDAQVAGRSSNNSTPTQRSSSRTAASSTYAPSHYGQNGSAASPYSLNGDGNAVSFSAYPNADGVRSSGEFRSATPDRRGQYSGAVLDELESQNEEQVGEMAKRVRMLKDITVAIGSEIRDSTAFAEKMNDQFEGTRNRLRGTMNRMLIMAERTGIGWRVWLGFFAFLILLFLYVYWF